MMFISAGFVVALTEYGSVGAAEMVSAHSADTIQNCESIVVCVVCFRERI